ncbi:MAG: hypothetical protein KJ900_07385, partial [Proteobacteria bacterium]|nr:hypothetical protein [Pseudomonadota bacterium]MCG2744998.1 hypothetical protein [Desulfobacteraceae bacterium]MBU4027507.1 hypothetical protein [Pseudomonadota bacterium]MBU4042706.1 hypothetical protein [Pseudomonadota bacterium]MBU4085358.1 hypothetical protein [Pseudomonadota bacterium]
GKSATFHLPDPATHPKKIFSIYSDRACPTNGSDCGSLRSHNLTLFVRKFLLFDLYLANFGSKIDNVV